MIKITFDCANIEDALLLIAAARNAGIETSLPVTPKSPSKPSKATPDPKSASTESSAGSPSTAAASSTIPPADAAAKKESESSAASTANPYKGVGEAIAAAVAAGHRAQVVEVLGAHNAKSGKDLKAEQYGDFLAALAVKLGGGGEDLG